MAEAGRDARRLRAFFVGAVAVLVGLLVYQLTRHPTSDEADRRLVEQVVYLAPFFLSVVMTTVAAIRAPKGDDRRFWGLLAAVMGFVLVLEVTYAYWIATGQQAVGVGGPWAFVLAAIPALIFAYLLASLSRATEAAWPSRLHYLFTGLTASIVLFLMTYGMLVEPFLDSLGLTNHVIQAQVAFRTSIGFAVLIGTFLNVGGLKATAWRRWEMLTVGGIAVYALGLCLEPLLVASELGWPSYAEQIAEALWMTGPVHGLPRRRVLPCRRRPRDPRAPERPTVGVVGRMDGDRVRRACPRVCDVDARGVLRG